MISFNFSIFLQAATLTGLLVVIAYRDLCSYRIADALNAVLAISGFAFSAWAGTTVLRDAVLASLVIGSVFWLMRYLFKRWRNIEGLGMGDVKFATAAGLWLTPFHLPWFVLIASLSGILHHLIKGAAREERLPFGPHLALGLFASWLLKILDVV